MNCKSCMNEVELDSKFCPYCGVKIEITQKSNIKESSIDFKEEHEKIRLLYDQQVITQGEYLKRKSDLHQKYGINPYENHKTNKLDRRGPFAQTSKPWLFWWLTLMVLIFITTVLQDSGLPQSLAYAINGVMLFLMPTVRK